MSYHLATPYKRDGWGLDKQHPLGWIAAVVSTTQQVTNDPGYSQIPAVNVIEWTGQWMPDTIAGVHVRD